MRREPGQILRQGPAQGDKRPGHQRLHAHKGRGHQDRDRHAVHQGRRRRRMRGGGCGAVVEDNIVGEHRETRQTPGGWSLEARRGAPAARRTRARTWQTGGARPAAGLACGGEELGLELAKARQEMRGGVRKLSRSSRDMALPRGAELRTLLVELDDEGAAWQLAVDFWSEMLPFVAPLEDVKGHVEPMGRGGEFVMLASAPPRTAESPPGLARPIIVRKHQTWSPTLCGGGPVCLGLSSCFLLCWEEHGLSSRIPGANEVG